MILHDVALFLLNHVVTIHILLYHITYYMILDYSVYSIVVHLIKAYFILHLDLFCCTRFSILCLHALV